MTKKLTITVDDEIYAGLHSVKSDANAGRRQHRHLVLASRHALQQPSRRQALPLPPLLLHKSFHLYKSAYHQMQQDLKNCDCR